MVSLRPAVAFFFFIVLFFYQSSVVDSQSNLISSFLSDFLPQLPDQREQQPEVPPSNQSDEEVQPTEKNQSSGRWEIVSENSGVSAMHLVIMRDNKAIMFDATVFGPSQIKLPEGVPCRPEPDGKNKELDCWAHAVEFDVKTYAVRPLKVLTDTWCSSGAFDAEGSLVQTGGWKDGGRGVRYLEPCDTCDWQEYPTALSVQRWYTTQQILPDGRFILVGGRRQFSYEYVPPPGQSNKFTDAIQLPFLQVTTERGTENNLYPFVYLSTDGNLFIFANSRGILIDPKTNKIIRELPQLSGGARNYPGSAMSALLPLDLRNQSRHTDPVTAEVIICGGAQPRASILAQKENFVPALKSCGRMVITDKNPTWQMEDMPVPRVMGDMLILPNGELLLINGASQGSAGWYWATNPVFTPFIYNPVAPVGERFTEMAASTIARMYHSTSAVLPDGSILVAGSNPNDGYKFTEVNFPTEMRIEKFYPPYLDDSLNAFRPVIEAESVPQLVNYGRGFKLHFSVEAGVPIKKEEVMVTMYSPPFTTHGTSMNQRLLILKTKKFGSRDNNGGYTVSVATPPSPVLAPPGYYMLFVVNGGVPSEAAWIKINDQK